MQDGTVLQELSTTEAQDISDFMSKAGKGVIFFERMPDEEILTELEIKKGILKLISGSAYASIEGVLEFKPIKGDYFIKWSDQLPAEYLYGAFISRPDAEELLFSTHIAVDPSVYGPVEKNMYSPENYKSVSIRKIAYYSSIALSISIAIGSYSINSKGAVGLSFPKKDININREIKMEPDELSDIRLKDISPDVPASSFISAFIEDDDLLTLCSFASVNEMELPVLKNISDITFVFDCDEEEVPLGDTGIGSYLINGKELVGASASSFTSDFIEEDNLLTLCSFASVNEMELPDLKKISGITLIFDYDEEEVPLGDTAIGSYLINGEGAVGLSFPKKDIIINRESEMEPDELTDIRIKSISSDVPASSFISDFIEEDNLLTLCSFASVNEMELPDLKNISGITLIFDCDEEEVPLGDAAIGSYLINGEGPAGLSFPKKDIIINKEIEVESDELTNEMELPDLKNISGITLIFDCDEEEVPVGDTAIGSYHINGEGPAGLSFSKKDIIINREIEVESDELKDMQFKAISSDVPASFFISDFIEEDNLHILFSFASVNETELPDLKNISDITIIFDCGEEEVSLGEFINGTQVSAFRPDSNEDEDLLVRGQMDSYDLLNILFNKEQIIPNYQVILADFDDTLKPFDIRVIMSDTVYQNVEGVTFQRNHKEPEAIAFNEKAGVSTFRAVKNDQEYNNSFAVVSMAALKPFRLSGSSAKGIWNNIILIYDKIKKNMETVQSTDCVTGPAVLGRTDFSEQEAELLRSVGTFLFKYLNERKLEDETAGQGNGIALSTAGNTGTQPEEDEVIQSVVVTKNNEFYLSGNSQSVDAIMGIINGKESLTDISAAQNQDKSENVFSDEEKIALAEIFTGAKAVKAEEAQSAEEVNTYTHTNTTDKYNGLGIDDADSQAGFSIGKSPANTEADDINNPDNKKEDPYVSWTGDPDEIDYEIPENIGNLNSGTISEKDIIEISWKLLGSAAMGTAAAFGIYIAAKAIQGKSSGYNLNLQEMFEEFKMNTAKFMPENADKLTNDINMLGTSTSLASFFITCFFAGTTPSSASLVAANSVIFAVMYALKMSSVGKEAK